MHGSWIRVMERRYRRLQGRGQNLGVQDRDILLQLPLKNSLQSSIDGDRDHTEGREAMMISIQTHGIVYGQR